MSVYFPLPHPSQSTETLTIPLHRASRSTDLPDRTRRLSVFPGVLTIKVYLPNYFLPYSLRFRSTVLKSSYNLLPSPCWQVFPSPPSSCTEPGSVISLHFCLFHSVFSTEGFGSLGVDTASRVTLFLILPSPGLPLDWTPTGVGRPVVGRIATGTFRGSEVMTPNISLVDKFGVMNSVPRQVKITLGVLGWSFGVSAVGFDHSWVYVDRVDPSVRGRVEVLGGERDLNSLAPTPPTPSQTVSLLFWCLPVEVLAE